MPSGVRGCLSITLGRGMTVFGNEGGICFYRTLIITIPGLPALALLEMPFAVAG